MGCAAIANRVQAGTRPQAIIRWFGTRIGNGTNSLEPTDPVIRSLIIEDDDRISRSVARALKSEGIACHVISDVTADLDLEAFLDCRLVVIDIMTIEGFYLEFLTRVRATLPNTRLLLLSAGEGLLRELEVFGCLRRNCVANPHDKSELAEKIAVAIHHLVTSPAPAPDTAPTAAHEHLVAPQENSRQPAAKPASPPLVVRPLPAKPKPAVDTRIAELSAMNIKPLAVEPLHASFPSSPVEFKRRCHVVVLGSEKGGTGKSTIAMHLIASLLHENFAVASLDLDSRQGSLTRYAENRRAFATKNAQPLPQPAHCAIPLGNGELVRFETALEAFLDSSDYLVIDTPGSDTALSRMAHAWADTLITPINDSFIDLDILARFEPGKLNEAQPSHYGKVIQSAKEQKRQQNGSAIDWVVLRNRLSNIASLNKGRMADTLAGLADQIGFRQGSGLRERVIYRELFASGLTLVDLKELGLGRKLTLSHVAARQELRALRSLLGLDPTNTEAAKADATPDLQRVS